MKDFFKVMGKAFAIAFGSVSASALVLVLPCTSSEIRHNLLLRFARG